MDISSNHYEHITKQRHDLAAGILGLGSLFTLFFALFNTFITGFYVTAVVDAVMATTFGYLLFTLKNRHDVRPLLRGATIFFVVTILALVLYTGGRNMNMLWMVMMPLLFLIVFGSRGGVLLSAVVGGISLILLLVLLFGRGEPLVFTTVSLVNVMGVYITIGLMAYFYERSRQEAETAIMELALTDPLSGIGNRRFLVECCEREIAVAQRYDNPLSFIIIDIDFFKLLNDRYGHQAGDAVIRYLTASVVQRLRKSDHFGRLGGEEFGIVLPHTALEEAKVLAANLCHRIDADNFTFQGETIDFTISIGVAELHPGAGFSTLYQEADKALYLAKQKGRNRAVAWTGE